MSWPITEVARMSGVTSRTLRHYDEIGLLKPARVAGNGHRRYEEPQLLRLQQILVLRELGLGLGEIARVLDDQVDEVEALRAHHERLLREHRRLGVLADTVARTIAELQERQEKDMPRINRPENLFEGLDPARYEPGLHERWPELAARSGRLAETMTAADVERGQRERTAQMIRLAELMSEGAPADDPAVQAEVHRQYEAFCQVLPLDAEDFRAIGRSCADDGQWRAAYEQIAPGLAEYQRDAIESYVRDRLT